jgi:uncharacterized membrane protein YccF (DUF307 family)
MAILSMLFFRIPLCLIAVTFGLFACMTIIGLPFGLTLIALGFKSLTLQPQPRVQVVRIYRD